MIYLKISEVDADKRWPSIGPFSKNSTGLLNQKLFVLDPTWVSPDGHDGVGELILRDTFFCEVLVLRLCGLGTRQCAPFVNSFTVLTSLNFLFFSVTFLGVVTFRLRYESDSESKPSSLRTSLFLLSMCLNKCSKISRKYHFLVKQNYLKILWFW